MKITWYDIAGALILFALVAGIIQPSYEFIDILADGWATLLEVLNVAR